MMELREASASEYFGIFCNPVHVFNSRPFVELNSDKCDEVRYLIFSVNGKARIGLILGRRGRRLCSPFSAPFGGFDTVRDPGLDTFDEAMSLLGDYARRSECTVEVTLPPLFYDSRRLPLVATLGINDSRIIVTADYNYHFDCRRMTDYQSALNSQARNKLNTARRHDYTFIPLSSKNPADVARAYEVIRVNREQHGYPLRMSLEAVMATVAIVPAEFFVLSLEGVDVAAAQVFYVAPGIAQVIYWGDIAGYSDRRPMNMLAFRLFEYLAEKVSFVDVGPSSSDGVPSLGLCSFKESVGCLPSPKYRLAFPCDGAEK